MTRMMMTTMKVVWRELNVRDKPAKVSCSSCISTKRWCEGSTPLCSWMWWDVRQEYVALSPLVAACVRGGLVGILTMLHHATLSPTLPWQKLHQRRRKKKFFWNYSFRELSLRLNCLLIPTYPLFHCYLSILCWTFICTWDVCQTAVVAERWRVVVISSSVWTAGHRLCLDVALMNDPCGRQ